MLLSHLSYTSFYCASPYSALESCKSKLIDIGSKGRKEPGLLCQEGEGLVVVPAALEVEAGLILRGEGLSDPTRSVVERAVGAAAAVEDADQVVMNAGTREDRHELRLSQLESQSLPNEAELHQVVGMYRPSSMRLIRDRKNGESRGFAFVEFNALEHASKFVHDQSDRLMLHNKLVHVDFSHAGGNNPKQSKRGLDWVCGRCECMNFARRDKCFQCGVPQGADATYVSQDPNSEGSSVTPNAVLVIRNMDLNTSEQTVRSIFNGFVAAGTKDVRLITERDTNQSRGFCFVEFYTPEDATAALGMSVGLRIDNAVVRVAFARKGDHMGMDGPWERGRSVKGQKIAPKRPPNIASTFKWDQQSGYWFDAQTGFYYDTTSQLYCTYHNETRIYYRWDMTLQQYVQVDSRGVKVETTPSSSSTTSSSSPSSSSSTPNAVSTSPAVIEAAPQPAVVPAPVDKAEVIKELSQSISLAFKAVGASKKGKKRSNEPPKSPLPRSPMVEAAPPAIPPPIDETMLPPAIPDTDIPVVVDKWINIPRNQCLLCKRQFKDADQLTKHVQKSSLHKKNLEVEMYKEIQHQARKEADAKVAAHRAEAESIRRAERVFEDMVQSAAKKTAEEKRTKPIEASNKGNKMLKAMGWKEGTGLGKNGKGIVAPIKAVMLDGNAGLGASTSYDASKISALRTESGYNSQSNREKARQRYGKYDAAQAPTAAPANEYLAMMAQFKSSQCDDEDYGHRALLK
eukprot:g15896.t1